MTVADVVNEYIAIINKLEELRLLLKKKLIQLKAIDSSGLIDGENVTLPKLLTKVNPTDINSITNKQLPNQPVDLTDDFVTDFKINGSFNSQYSIEDFNSLLIDKFNFYREYLMYQLENMGVSKNEINQAITIKNLILLLDKVDKIKTIDNITCDDTTIYINQNNILDVYIYDETGIEVEKGTLEIYENGTCIYSENIGEEVIITPTTIGEHTYNFKYVNKDKNTNTTINKYITSELFSITIDVIYPPLEGSFTLQNITTTSKYYTGNEDDFIGYENDKWDIDVNIFDINQNSINQTIPFDIYMYDDQHLVTSGVTDTTGHVKLTNVTIPYANSDLIDFRESAITFYITDEQQNNVVTTDNIDELSFIKNPTFVDGRLTYKRAIFTKNNYLDDLNGCVIDVQQNGTSIQYTTFSTSEHIKLSEINNLSETIGHLVTEVFYKTKTINDVVTITELDYETLVNKKYQYDKNSPDYSVPLILKTTLDDPTHPNVELYHDITIYHVPFRIDTELTWYKTDPNIPSGIAFVLYDEETNQPLDHLEQTYKLNINGTEYSMDSPTYIYKIDMDALPYGETNLNVTLYENDIEFITLNKKITLLSNFELPSQTTYYANDTPDIYYKPKGIVTQNKQVKVNNITKYTNAKGLIHDIKSDNTIGTHNLTLVASSDDLTEQKTFSYEIKEPFTITRLSYDQYSSVVYQIVFYYPHIVDVNDYVIITDKNNNTINYTYEESIDVQNNIETFNITINKTNNNVGINTITVTANNYTESQTFEFFSYEHLYELITTEIGVGSNKIIQVKCNDPNVNTINISGDGISVSASSDAIVKNNDIFSVKCDIQKAAPNGTTIVMTDGNITETSTLVIPRGTVNGSLFISPTVSGTHTTSFPSGQSTDMILFCSLTLSGDPFINTQFIINDGINDHNVTLSNTTYTVTSQIVNFKNTNLTPGTYIATITFNGNDNFNSYKTSLMYTVTADGTLTLTPSSDFLDSSHTSTTLTATYINGNNQPISGATIDITTTGVTIGTIGESGGPSSTIMQYDPKTTNSSGITTFTVNSVGTWKAYHRSGNTFYAVSNSSDIRGEPYISLQHPSAQYSIGDIIPLTFLVNDQKGNALEGIDLVINIDGNSYDGVTDAFGQYVMNYTVLSAKDIDITVTSVENNYYSSTSIHETITIEKLNTLTVLTSSNSSSNISFVEEFTLSATVSTDISQPIEGTVSFYDNEVLLDNVSLVDNIANYTYSTNEIKEHNFYAVFNGSSEYYSSQSSNLTINIVKDTPIINVITGDIYQSWYTACIITDSLGHPLTGKDINIKVSKDNSTFSSYPQISDDEGKSKIQMNWNPCTVYSQYIFDGDSQYTAVTANKTFIIKSPLTQSKCTGTMTSGSNEVPYREWVDVYSDCDDNYCKCTNIATSSGSYKRPAALTGSVNFNLPANATVKNLKADWKSQLVKYTSGSGYASIGAPTIIISGDGSGSAHTKTDGTPGKGSYVSGTFNYSGANAAGLNDGVAVKVQFPANTSGEIGQIYFIGVKLTATYIPAQEVI